MSQSCVFRFSFDEGEKVIIQQWVSDDRVVKVSILPHNAQHEAAKVLRRFADNNAKSERLPDVGDEAYTWGIRKSVIFRKRNFTIYVSTVATNITDEAARSKEFARLVAAALANP